MPISFVTRIQAGRCVEDFHESFNFWTCSIDDLVAMDKVSEPDCYAVQDHHFRIFRQRSQGGRWVNRRLQSKEGGISLTAMLFDTGPHLVIRGFRSGNEDLVAIGCGEFQGMVALAASTASGY